MLRPADPTLGSAAPVRIRPGLGIHLYNARNYLPDFINRDNIILIGARKSNPWDELFDGRMNFITEFDSPRVVNRVPAAGQLPVYPQSDSDGYCVAAYMPSSDRNRQVLLIEGTNAEATEAAGDFLLSEDQLSNFKKMLQDGEARLASCAARTGI